ncbi:MAG TPA: energy transducer TonB [Terriglobales bacterium]|nr:energy transducer TonB [Terriglobales bacterium]
MKNRCCKGIRSASAWIALLVPMVMVAQQHASFHAVEYRDNPAGRSMIGGPLVDALCAPNPRYTKEARKAKVTGVVVLEGTLGRDGCLRQVKVVRVLGYGLDHSAIEAVLRWRFKPFLKDGKRAETKVLGEVKFDPDWSSETLVSKEPECGEK